MTGYNVNVAWDCKHYGIPESTMSKIVLGRFIRGPDDDSKESKHVALR